VLGDVGLVSGLDRRVGLVSGRVQRGRLNVGTCKQKLAYCRDEFGEVGLVLGFVRKCRLRVGTCSAMSAIFGTFSAWLI